MLRGLVRLLGTALTTQQVAGRVAPAVLVLTYRWITRLRERFAELAEQVAAGQYRPRPEPKIPPQPATEPPAGQKPSATPGKPPQGEKLFRKCGWLAALLPADQAAPLRGYLLRWLQQPEMVALVEAAPKPAKRLLRPLCWALGWRPPPILALPRRPRPPRPPKVRQPRPSRSARVRPPPPQPPPAGPDAPWWLQGYRPSADWSSFPVEEPSRRRR
jgi:hypothetical protein